MNGKSKNVLMIYIMLSLILQNNYRLFKYIRSHLLSYWASLKIRIV